MARLPFNSSRYRRLNSANLSGRWSNHCRSDGVGARSLAQRSRAAASLRSPRGHRRSTKMRMPSLPEGGSYTRLITKSVIVYPPSSLPSPPANFHRTARIQSLNASLGLRLGPKILKGVQASNSSMRRTIPIFFAKIACRMPDEIRDIGVACERRSVYLPCRQRRGGRARGAAPPRAPGAKAMTKGADLLVAALESEGVKRIFGLPGEENLDVLESLR